MNIMKDAQSAPLGYIPPYTSLHTQVSGNPPCCRLLRSTGVLPASNNIFRVGVGLATRGCAYKMKLKWRPWQVPGYVLSQERRDWRDYSPPEQQPLPPAHHHATHADLQYGQCHYLPPFSRPWSTSHAENGEMSTLHTK